MTEPIKIRTDDPTFSGTWYRDRRPQQRGLAYLFIPLLLVTALASGWVGARIEKDRPVVDDPGFVNVEGHEGEVLVVGTDGTLLWTTEAELQAGQS